MLLDEELARRIEGALSADLLVFAAGMAELEPGSGAAGLVVGGGSVTFTGPGLLGARGQGLGLYGPMAAAEVDVVIRFLHERKVPSAVEVCPMADRSLVEVLAARGHHLSGFRDILAVQLDGLAPAPIAPPTARPGTAIEVKIVEPDEWGIWSEVLLDGFAYEAGPRRARLVRWNEMMSRLPEARLLTAVVDGVTVGASNVLIHQTGQRPVASLGGAATLVPYRRRGVQLALLRARLDLARRQGCDLAVVTADPGSSSGRNARRAGFALAYTNARLSQSGTNQMGDGSESSE